MTEIRQIGTIGSGCKNGVYLMDGVCPCILSTCYKDPPKVVTEGMDDE